MKAHQKRKHDRRVAHQRIQRQRKLDAISESVEICKQAGSITKKKMIEFMKERGYYLVNSADWGTMPGAWKRMEHEEKKSKAKKVPGS